MVFSGYLVKGSNKTCQMFHSDFILKKKVNNRGNNKLENHHITEYTHLIPAQFHTIMHIDNIRSYSLQNRVNVTLAMNVLIHNSLCKWFTVQRMLISPKVLVWYYVSS